MRPIIFSLRVVALALMALCWLVAGLLVCLLRPMHRGNVYALTQMLRLAQPVLGVRVVMDFTYADLRARMPAIFVGLHQSNWDIITMADLPQPGLVCVGKKSLIYAPIFGILFWLSGNVLLDRESRSRSGEALLRIVQRLNSGGSVWMFPEGTRSGRGPVGKFRSGAMHTAMLAKARVVPFVTSTYSGQIDLGRWDNGEIHISILPTVDGAALGRQELSAATQRLRADMVARMHELDRRARRPAGYELPPGRDAG
ncbi:MAG: 1-acyl-sn-glycerol-3-phosphate acyltransferase [Succinivibrionaceae bacterium]|nr:1-acyl-sn-glycerol-3-phosphate acyltransferase [Succinivibrionaceae bacterium]